MLNILDIDHHHMMDLWHNIFGVYLWIPMVLGMIAYFAIGFIIANYVHKDAIRRGIKNSEIWLVIAFFFNVLGLLLYLLVRGNYRERTPRQD